MKPLRIIRFFSLLMVIIWVAPANAQTTVLPIKQKGKNITSLRISLCDKAGSKSIAPEDFRKSDRVYFLLEPHEGYSKPVFRESEVKEELSKIVLWQPEPGKYLSAEVNPVIVNKRIVGVVLAYPKSETRAHLPFTFGIESHSSEELVLDETYYDLYPQFKAFLDATNRQISGGEWLEAYFAVNSFLQKEEVKKYLRHYSFAQKLTDELPLLALSKGAAEKRTSFDRKFEAFEAAMTKANLEAVRAAAAENERYLRLTAAYKSMDYKSSAAYASIWDGLNEHTKATLERAEQRFDESRFAVLKAQNYLEQPFATFLDLIYQSFLLTLGESSTQWTNFRPVLTASKHEELRVQGWLDALSELYTAIDKRRKSIPATTLVPADLIQQLEGLKSSQPKPYYEIFKLVAEHSINPEARIELIQAAINSCAMENELILLEMWKARFVTEMDGKMASISPAMVEGIRQLNANNIDRACELLDQALRQQPGDAIAWYLRALAHYRSGEIFAAEAKLDKSLELNHELLSALILKIKMLHESHNYEVLEQIFARPVSNGPNYLFELQKAAYLIEKNKPTEAIKVLESGPLALCPGQTAPYFLLGDAWSALRQPDKARQAYLKTQLINPFDSALFEQKMRALEKK